MSYEIKDLGNDKFELLRIEPVVIGVLTDRRIAERFADFLTSLDDAEHAQMDLFIIADDVAEIEGAAPDVRNVPAQAVPEEILTVAQPDPTPSIAAGETAADPTPAIATQQNEVPPKVAPSDAAKETPMEEAFRRLRAGEALGVVADDIGIPMPRLRSLWAHKCRANKGDMAQAVAPMGCATCGREMKVTSPDGLCARCTRDVGRA